MFGRVAASKWAAFFLLVLTIVGSPVAARAQLQVDVAALDPALLASPAPVAAEPFGLKTVPATNGTLSAKWSGVAADIRAESDILAHCRDHSRPCPPAAQKFLAVIAEGRAHDGRARIGIVNRDINMAIRATSDLAQWGVPDRWSAPLATLTTGRGDCEDYAIAKYVALLAAGIDESDLRLVIVHDLAIDEDHAVVTVRFAASWIVLDNRWLTLVEDSEMRRVVPLFVLAHDGVGQFAPTTVADMRPVMAPAAAVAVTPSALGL
jgi:predicted transglutaminase-like cysteine proteinase